MSVAYDDYLKDHISFVKQAGERMLSYGIVPFDDYETRRKFALSLGSHDDSKYSIDEYDAYDDYFYGKDGLDEDDISVIDQCFDYAWLHHIHENDHHWQHWILYEDEGKVKALEMPPECAYHMIADWWSFSLKNEKPDEIFGWYDEHKEKMQLHPKTRKLVEDALKAIKEHLEDIPQEE